MLAKDTIAFGVNGGDAKSHQDFKNKNDFPFPLLIDDGRKVTKLYKADMWVAANRTVYLIGKDGTIRFAKRGMPPPSEVLTAAQ